MNLKRLGSPSVQPATPSPGRLLGGGRVSSGGARHARWCELSHRCAARVNPASTPSLANPIPTAGGTMSPVYRLLVQRQAQGHCYTANSLRFPGSIVGGLFTTWLAGPTVAGPQSSGRKPEARGSRHAYLLRRAPASRPTRPRPLPNDGAKGYNIPQRLVVGQLGCARVPLPLERRTAEGVCGRRLALAADVVEILEGCGLFAQLKPPSFQRLFTMARLVHFAKGEMIFRDGQVCPGVYVVGSGLVRVFKIGAGGKEHVLHLVGPGETFAEVAAIGDFPCPAHAEALAASCCVLLPASRFRQALAEDHQLCLDLMVSLTLWVRQLVSLMEDVVLRDAAGRVARYLLDTPAGPDGLVHLPSLKRHVASHLNLTSETFSRTIRRLAEAGVIEPREGNRLALRDRARLRQVAEGLLPPEDPGRL
ncbi:MAG TPA: Crp/Fnr family transcriptional regulator [Planctomycetaceae bacterium]|nr:Crp/Fnr family transcriptional regulator [Planctomycetaceae bacterium]